MRPGTKGPKSTAGGSAISPDNTEDEAPARKKERELFARLMRVKQYPIAPDEPSAEPPESPPARPSKTTRR